MNNNASLYAKFTFYFNRINTREKLGIILYNVLCCWRISDFDFLNWYFDFSTHKKNMRV